MAIVHHQIPDYEHDGDYALECRYVRKALEKANISDYTLELCEEERERDWDDEDEDDYDREPDGYVVVKTKTTSEQAVQKALDDISYWSE